MHPDLRLAGALPPLDAPHHMRSTEWAMYREGVVISSVSGEGSLLNVGLDKVSSIHSGSPCVVCSSIHGQQDLCLSDACFGDLLNALHASGLVRHKQVERKIRALH